jgi:hypothetical protein
MPNSINFFNTGKELQISDSLFGIVEDRLARVSLDTNETWDAIVKNDSYLDLTFSPIDHVLDLRLVNGQVAKKTDAMLYILTRLLILVELKAEDNPFAFYTDANKQLKQTIDFMKINNSQELGAFLYKFAYIANRVRPTNHSIRESHTKTFYKLTGFLLQVVKDTPNNVINIDELLEPPI